jgi:UDP-N-acetylglucosamine 2-epimerase (non-hydrolysing)
MKKKVGLIFGTRPEAIKLGPVYNTLSNSEEIQPVLIHTGQHHDLAEDILELFDMKTDYRFDAMQSGETLDHIRYFIEQELDKVFNLESFDMIIVQGDTATAHVGAITAKKHEIPLAHVEAGLRSFDMNHPWPEELYRTEISTLADYHYAPTQHSRQNLLAEGVTEDSIIVTGNTVVDALNEILSRISDSRESIAKRFGLSVDERIVLLTSHRRENFGEPQKRIFNAVKKLVDDISDIHVIFPVHPNPAVKLHLHILEGHSRIHIMEPIPYLQFLPVIKAADLILTDSGGIQEEAPALGKYTIVLREKTERPELIESGAGILAGSDEELIYKLSKKALSERLNLKSESIFGDGKAAGRISDHIHSILN